MDENMEAAVVAAKKPVAFIQNTINTLKGKDIETKIEEFSSEITLVIEGISDDQERLDKNNQQLKDKLAELAERVSAIEKTVGKKAVGLTIIRQLTWLAGIVCASIILITIIRMLG